MKEYVINVSRIEELQTLHDLHELDLIFSRARSTIVNGEKVVMVRTTGSAPPQKFDELSTLEDLELLRARVFKYL